MAEFQEYLETIPKTVEEPEEDLVEGQGRRWGKEMPQAKTDYKDRIYPLATYSLREDPPLTALKITMCELCQAPLCNGNCIHDSEDHDECYECERCTTCGECTCDSNSCNYCDNCSECTGCDEHMSNWCDDCEKCTDCCDCEGNEEEIDQRGPRAQSFRVGDVIVRPLPR